MEFLAKIGLTQTMVQDNITLLLRIWVFNLGFSGFLAVTVYSIEEEFNFTSKTALYALVCNLFYALLLIILLRKMLRKTSKPFGVI